jgi:hypothetical protein
MPSRPSPPSSSWAKSVTIAGAKLSLRYGAPKRLPETKFTGAPNAGSGLFGGVFMRSASFRPLVRATYTGPVSIIGWAGRKTSKCRGRRRQRRRRGQADDESSIARGIAQAGLVFHSRNVSMKHFGPIRAETLQGIRQRPAFNHVESTYFFSRFQKTGGVASIVTPVAEIIPYVRSLFGGAPRSCAGLSF